MIFCQPPKCSPWRLALRGSGGFGYKTPGPPAVQLGAGKVFPRGDVGDREDADEQLRGARMCRYESRLSNNPNGNLAVNLETRLVTVDGNPLYLTSKEYEILELLSLRKGTILTKEMFLNHLYPEMDEPKSRSSMCSCVNCVRS